MAKKKGPGRGKRGQPATAAPLTEHIRRAYHLLATLRERLEDATHGSFPSGTPIRFARTLIGLVDILNTKLICDYAASVAEIADQDPSASVAKAQDRLRKRILMIPALAAKITPMVKFIDGARAQNNPWGLVEQFERVSRAVLPESELIIRPRWEYNYSFYPITSMMRQHVVEANAQDGSLGTALRSAVAEAPFFFSLAFPPSEMANMLQIAVWGHEIGHLIDKVEGEKRSGRVEQYWSSLVTSEIEFKVPGDKLAQLVGTLPDAAGQKPSEVDLDELGDSIAIPLGSMLRGWAEEIFPDLVSVQVLGPAALMAYYEFATTTSRSLDDIKDRRYPPPRLRLRILLDALQEWSGAFPWTEGLAEQERIAYDGYLQHVEDVAEGEPPEVTDAPGSPIDAMLRKLLWQIADQVVTPLKSAVSEFVASHPSGFLHPSDLRGVPDRIESLRNHLPPNRFGIDSRRGDTGEGHELAQILVAGWIHWITKRPALAHPWRADLDHSLETHSSINRLLLKAIESTQALQWFAERAQASFDVVATQPPEATDALQAPRGDGQGTPGERRSAGRLWLGSECLEDQPAALVVTPIIDRASQVGPASVDVRLGNDFINTRKRSIAAFDAADPDAAERVRDYQTHVYVPFGSSLVIHPGELVLGGTLEYLSVPSDLVGLVIGRSSWGRLGLVIATATKVDPGFRGILTLELVNQGSVPIRLYPGTRIAQLVFYPVETL
jgi:dCTP deaminase